MEQLRAIQSRFITAHTELQQLLTSQAAVVAEIQSLIREHIEVIESEIKARRVPNITSTSTRS